MIEYIIKSSLCLILMWSFYKLFLEKENMHYVKRFYLIFSLVFALVLPMITITYEVEAVSEPEIVENYDIALDQLVEPPVIQKESTNYLVKVLWSLYLIGVLIFGFRFMRNLMHLIKKVRINEKLEEPSHTHVLLNDTVIPYTFLKYIFVHRTAFLKRAIPEEVLYHEQAHVRQKHTIDILFVEVLQVIFWFNPMFFLIKKSIKLNHEFLADQTVLKQQYSIQQYIDLLVNYPNSSNQTALSSTINYSLTKKRLQMMTKEFSRKRAIFKLLASAPVLLVCILFFNYEIIAKERIAGDDITNLKILESSVEEIPVINVLKEEPVSSKELKVSYTLQEQDGVSKKMLNKYNAWAKDLNNRIKNNKQITIYSDDIDQMKAIYDAMSSKQREKAEKFPDIPPPPPAPEVRKGERSNIPPPPPPSNVASAPIAPIAPIEPLESEEEIEAIEESLEREMEEVRAEEREVLAEAEMVIAETEREEQEVRRNAIESARTATLAAQKARNASVEAKMEARRNAIKDARAAALEVKRVREEAEKARAVALRSVLENRSEADEIRMKKAGEIRREVFRARELAEKARAKAMVNAKKARAQGIKDRERAILDAELTRTEARKAMEIEREKRAMERELSREEALLARKIRQEQRLLERENDNEEDRKKLEKQMKKVEKESRRAIEKAKKRQIEATKKLQEAEKKALKERLKTIEKIKKDQD
ncbi:M56 family metallopeptidase [Aquimarina sp. 2201CG5-10]|uniref:M56 family metallopeptidase n=1 Tax=Aquimarina callyspongiae TaxID=3098150 RepID=UPI002AB353D9|nr:M56 family metallopeptidase [Aquimarina sp. 2201CG5-10]MDY8134840.1 M56 family metallopeptidase [Aquimarina sp. 2201CG5-10]